MSEGRPAQATARTRVLVAEDDSSGRMALRLVLSSAGYEVDEARDGRAALERVATRPPDLVLLDRRLPGLDGDTVCRALKAEYPTLPVLMLTGAATTEERLAGFAAGADDYVTKPYDIQELLARVAVFDRLQRAEAVARRRASEMATLLTLAHVLLAETDPLLVLRRAVEVAQQLLPAEGTTISLVDGERWRIVALRTAEGWRTPDVSGGREEGMHGWVLRHGQPYRMDDAADATMSPVLANRLEIRTAMVVPVLGRDGVVMALLGFYNRHGEPTFTEEDERVAMGIAAQAALALENVRLLATAQARAAEAAAATDTPNEPEAKSGPARRER